MKIKLDLRPQSYAESVSRGVDLAKIVATVLVLSFLVVSLTSFGYGFFLSKDLKKQRLALQNRIEALQVQNIKLGKELKRLKEKEADYQSALSLIEKELPSIEFLASLEKALPASVWLEKISISKGKVDLSGKAFTENDVVSFGKALLDAPVVKAVGFPVTNRVEQDGQSVVTFSLSAFLGEFKDLRSALKEEVAAR